MNLIKIFWRLGTVERCKIVLDRVCTDCLPRDGNEARRQYVESLRTIILVLLEKSSVKHLPKIARYSKDTTNIVEFIHRIVDISPFDKSLQAGTAREAKKNLRHPFLFGEACHPLMPDQFLQFVDERVEVRTSQLER
jgi:hypothetical protein